MCLLAAGIAVADPLTDRIAQSAAAAQALQGPLDGSWTLRGSDGAVLLTFEMSDPPERTGPVRGAWRDRAGEVGGAAFSTAGPHRLRAAIEGADPVTMVLIERRGGIWRGSFPGHGVVILTRGLATP